MERIKAATIGVFHHECQTSLGCEKFPGIELEQLSPVVYLSKRPSNIDYSLLWDIRASSPSELEEYLRYVKNDKATIKLHILEKRKTSASILLRFKGVSSTYDAVLTNGVTYGQNITAKAGYEIHNVIAPDPGRIGKMLSELSAIGDVKVMKIGDFKGRNLLPALTDKQAEAVKIALINNYYSWPRGATLSKLASVAKVSRRSLQERLRRAESKLFPYALEQFLKKL
jgi:predicted DNA binding protein